MSDQSLIAQVLEGQAQAFTMLVYRWQRKIYNFAYRYTMDRDVAGDIAQQTFIRAFKNLSRLKDPDAFSPWLYQITVNLCKDHLKKKKNRFLSLEALQEKHQESGTPLPRELCSGEWDIPDQAVQRRETVTRVQHALTQIPAEQREVVILKQFQGLKFSEIAEILDLPVNTVKSRMYYGLSAIRKVLEAND